MRWGCSRWATWRTPPEAPCAAPSGRTPAGCSTNWPGVGIRAGWSRWFPNAASGRQETFAPDSDDPGVVERELLRMADRTARRMRKQRVLGRTVSISVRFADFRELTRSATHADPDRRQLRDLRGGGGALRSARPRPRPDPAGRSPDGAVGRRRTGLTASRCSPTRNGAGARLSRRWTPPWASSGQPRCSGRPWPVADEPFLRSSILGLGFAVTYCNLDLHQHRPTRADRHAARNHIGVDARYPERIRVSHSDARVS